MSDEDTQKTWVTPRDAVSWFLRDMAEAAGYNMAQRPGADRLLSGYAAYRPVLTAPDPWYFAGVIALEGCKVLDYFFKDQAEELLREISEQADKIVGRDSDEVSTLAFFIMGRLGIGTVLLRAKAPDSMLGKLMSILLGSATAAASAMPAPEAHKQLRAALKLGEPVWWRVFRRRYALSMNPETETGRLAVMRRVQFAGDKPEDVAYVPAIFTAVKALEDLALEQAAEKPEPAEEPKPAEEAVAPEPAEEAEEQAALRPEKELIAVA